MSSSQPWVEADLIDCPSCAIRVHKRGLGSHRRGADCKARTNWRWVEANKYSISQHGYIARDAGVPYRYFLTSNTRTSRSQWFAPDWFRRMMDAFAKMRSWMVDPIYFEVERLDMIHKGVVIYRPDSYRVLIAALAQKDEAWRDAVLTVSALDPGRATAIFVMNALPSMKREYLAGLEKLGLAREPFLVPADT